MTKSLVVCISFAKKKCCGRLWGVGAGNEEVGEYYKPADADRIFPRITQFNGIQCTFFFN